MQEKIISTLALSILKSVHTLISLIFSYKLYSMASPKYLNPPLLEKSRSHYRSCDGRIQAKAEA
jgi:hypothetical protein